MRCLECLWYTQSLLDNNGWCSKKGKLCTSSYPSCEFFKPFNWIPEEEVGTEATREEEADAEDEVQGNLHPDIRS